MADERWDPKDPQDVDAFHNDWSKRLLVEGVNVGDTILTMAHADPLKRPSAIVETGDVVVEAVLLTGNIQTIWVSAGTKSSTVKLTIWTSQGRRCIQRRIITVDQN